MSRHADIGILTVLADCELPAMQRALGINPESDHDYSAAGTRYWEAELQAEHGGRPLRVALGCIASSGNPDSGAVTMSLISEYDPQVVCLVGIAAGVKSKLSLGDVVFSGAVLGYEKQKRKPSSVDYRPSRESPRRPMPEDVTYFISLQGRPNRKEELRRAITSQIQDLDPTAISSRYNRERVPKLKPVTIASGEKIFGDGSLDSLAALFNDSSIVCGEMEAIGFAIAAEKKQIPWIVIRGISDHGNPQSKDGRYKDKYHAIASVCAAEVAREFLSSGLTCLSQIDDVFLNAPPLEVRRVLLTLHDKSGLEGLVSYFLETGIEMVATPRTSKYLESVGADHVRLTFDFASCAPISFVRGTLHPYILAAIAADPTNQKQIDEISSVGVGKIGLVVVNTKTLDVPPGSSASELFRLLSEVQIGGPSLLRWAIKQWRTCAAVVNPADYGTVIDSLRMNRNILPGETREHLLRRSVAYLQDRDREAGRLLEQLWPANFGQKEARQ